MVMGDTVEVLGAFTSNTKLPKQVWVSLDFTKVELCQELDLVAVEFCLGSLLEPT